MKTNRRNFLKTLVGFFTLPAGLGLAKAKQKNKESNEWIFKGSASGICKTRDMLKKEIIESVQWVMKRSKKEKELAGKLIINYKRINHRLGNYSYHIINDIKR